MLVKRSVSSAAWIAVALVLLVLTVVPSFSQVNVQEIIEKSVQANRADWEVKPQYNYYERVRKSGHTKTSYVQMIFGSPYRRLVDIDGKPLSPQQNAEEERKLQQTIVERQNETPAERHARIDKYEKSRQRNHFLMEQMTAAFNFELTGTEKLDGHDVLVLSATRRPGYAPPNNQAKALTGMQGKLWIDQKTFQWVKVEAKVVHTVSIEGFLARVEPGTHFELEQMPVAPGIWFPRYFAVKTRAKLFFFIPHNSQEEDTYFDYRKAVPATSSKN